MFYREVNTLFEDPTKERVTYWLWFIRLGSRVRKKPGYKAPYHFPLDF